MKRRQSALTLVEVLVTIALTSALIIAGVGTTGMMEMSARRLAYHTAGMALIEAKAQAFRAATYNPPTSPFGATTVYLTNRHDICLNKAGTNFVVTGIVTAKVEPVASGHLVTITGTFSTPGKPMSMSLQTLVNKFSGGQE